MRIVDLDSENQEHLHQTAALLVAGFTRMSPSAWPHLDAAREEVREALEPGKICRIAIDDAGTVLGWIGGIPEYSGNAWQVHPLVVHPAHWGRGIGRALVADLERLVQERGAMTLYLGTDDEMDQTSLSGIDLYPDVTAHIAAIRNLRRHPYEFYQKVGFSIVGVIPDANGWGKPDILMAKRVGG